jgi:hypothetical protein
MKRLFKALNPFTIIFPVLIVATIAALVAGSASRSLLNTRNDPETAKTSGGIQTTQEPWWLMRFVATNDTALTKNTRQWTDIKAKAVDIPPSWNSVTIAMYAYGDGSGGGDPNTGTFSWRLYTCRKYGPAQLAAYGTGAIGEQILSHDPTDGTPLTLTNEDYKWAELPVLTSTVWSSDVNVSGASDDVGTINFDPLGAWGIYVEITNLTSITNLYVVFTGR